jgi:hypothetical protein
MQDENVFRKYVKLCQTYERVWNLGGERLAERDIRDFEEILGASEFSSCGASLCASLGKPLYLRLVPKGEKRGKGKQLPGYVDFARTKVLPPMISTNRIALLYDDRGPREMTWHSLRNTFERLSHFVERFEEEAKGIVISLASLSSGISKCLAELIEDQRGKPLVRGQNRNTLSNLFMMQDSLYRAIGIVDEDISILQEELRNRGFILSRIGVGTRGTFLLVKLNEMSDKDFEKMITDLGKSTLSFHKKLARRSGGEERRRWVPSWKIMTTLGQRHSGFIFKAKPQQVCLLSNRET